VQLRIIVLSAQEMKSKLHLTGCSEWTLPRTISPDISPVLCLFLQNCCPLAFDFVCFLVHLNKPYRRFLMYDSHPLPCKYAVHIFSLEREHSDHLEMEECSGKIFQFKDLSLILDCMIYCMA
jgi:hypothetical protein